MHLVSDHITHRFQRDSSTGLPKGGNLSRESAREFDVCESRKLIAVNIFQCIAYNCFPGLVFGGQLDAAYPFNL